MFATSHEFARQEPSIRGSAVQTAIDERLAKVLVDIRRLTPNDELSELALAFIEHFTEVRDPEHPNRVGGPGKYLFAPDWREQLESLGYIISGYYSDPSRNPAEAALYDACLEIARFWEQQLIFTALATYLQGWLREERREYESV